MGSKIKVGLVYGGKSGEHEVSLSTAFAVMGQFDYSKYEIKPFYITKQGEWRTSAYRTAPPASVEELKHNDGQSQSLNAALASIFHALQPSQGDDNAEAVEVMFPLLHGTFGEDGTIQGLFEMANIPYVGAGVLASAVGMDKILMKKVFAQEGLPQCIYRYFNRTQWEKDSSYFIMECEIALGYPCFVKPANLGSSVGVSKASNREELIQAVEYALRYDRKVIIEEFIDAREIEVSVLGNDEAKASMPGEITSVHDFYDYNAKYTDGKSTMQIPAHLPQDKIDAVRDMAVRAFQSIDGSGLSRVDFFMRKSDGVLFINEVNTLPGFTPYSMYPLMWKESGLSYKKLLDSLIDLAFSRYKDKQRILFTNE